MVCPLYLRYQESNADGHIKIENLTKELKKVGLFLKDDCLEYAQVHHNMGRYHDSNTK
jgi:hypothetical protein